MKHGGGGEEAKKSLSSQAGHLNGSSQVNPGARACARTWSQRDRDDECGCALTECEVPLRTENRTWKEAERREREGAGAQSPEEEASGD